MVGQEIVKEVVVVQVVKVKKEVVKVKKDEVVKVVD
jgi:hypothetical protein